MVFVSIGVVANAVAIVASAAAVVVVVVAVVADGSIILKPMD